MIDGKGLEWTTAGQTTGGAARAMPDPVSVNGTYATNTGHSGEGYARITCIPYD